MADLDPRREPSNAMPVGELQSALDSESTGRFRMAAPIAARIVLNRLEGIRRGHQRIRLPDGTIRTVTGSEQDVSPVTELHVHKWRFFRRLLLRGDIGAGEAYVDGDWSSPDLVALVRLFLDNEDELAPPTIVGAVSRLKDRLAHLLRSNTRKQARRNIHAHYDLSNQLYGLFLDPSMTYSSALFDHPGLDLEDAQRRKYRRLAEWAGLEEGQRVLEIGCGWGGFAEFAASEIGCSVTGITLSEAQARYARRRLNAAGLDDLAEIRVVDYRDVDDTFDAVVSIEMLEAVGHRFLDGFFATCDRVLAPGGRMALQTITIPDQVYDVYRRGTDWIRAYIFPGGHLPSLGAIQGSLARRTSLAVERLEDMADDYAATLKIWRRRFHDRAIEVRELGFDDRFIKMWDFYLATCEAAFSERQIGVLQLSLQRTGRSSATRR